MSNIKKILPLLLTLFALDSCSWGVEHLFNEQTDKVMEARGDVAHFEIIFSGNLNGETHPCGCRSFPLGGLPQVAGALAREKALYPVIYLDAGDTFFPQAYIPDSIIKSNIYTADTLIQGLDMLGLDFWLPGDQDFGQGADFLKTHLANAKFKILAANLNPDIGLTIKRFARIKVADQWIYITGLLGSDFLAPNVVSHLENPELAFEKVTREMDDAGYNPKRDYLIVLSHLGMDHDRELAKKFPIIDWIVGAHTQSFTNTAVEEGDTRIVQVLGKNHYLGKILFTLGPKSPAEWSLIEVRDELKDQIKPNPMSDFLDKYKSAVDKMRLQEANALGTVFNPGPTSIRTYRDCIGCHQDQHTFWKQTSHSLALTTLWQSKETHNPECISCHSIGFKSPDGFAHPDEFAVLAKKDQQANYLKQVHQSFTQTPGKVVAVKDLSAKEKALLSKKWQKLDDTFGVTSNFAHVQCLHCHDIADNHPFNPESGMVTKDKRAPEERYHNVCTKCHTPDRSPEWYEHGATSTDKELKKDFFKTKIKAISCPKSN